MKKTTEEAIFELKTALSELFQVFVKALKIDKFLEWLNNKLK